MAKAFHLYLSSLLSSSCSLTETMPRKLQRSDDNRLGDSEKHPYFLKFLKWQDKLVREYKEGKSVSYFLNNAAKTCLYGLKISDNFHGLKISDNFQIKYVFQSKAFFHLCNFLHTTFLSAFKCFMSIVE